jgi:hypothetical protein
MSSWPYWMRLGRIATSRHRVEESDRTDGNTRRPALPDRDSRRLTRHECPLWKDRECLTTLLALIRNDAAAAVRLLAADIDTPEVFQYIAAGPWRPWYAALWAEAAVLDHRDDAAARIERSRRAARGNPIATAMVERAAAIATCDHDALVHLAVTFARLGCPYQQARTAHLAGVGGRAGAAATGPRGSGGG